MASALLRYRHGSQENRFVTEANQPKGWDAKLPACDWKVVVEGLPQKRALPWCWACVIRPQRLTP